MPLYEYRAVDEKGNEVKGEMEDSSSSRVNVILQEQGLQVSFVREKGGGLRIPFLHEKLSPHDLHLFNEQLLAIVKSGLPLAPALRIMASELKRPRLRTVLQDVERRIESGESLSTALAHHKDAFPQSYVAAIAAGERMGNLTGVLVHLADHSRHTYEVHQRLRGALVYPTMVCAAAALVLWEILVVVTPGFAQVYGDFGTRLPAVTRALVATGLSAERSPIALFICLALIVTLIAVSMRIVILGEGRGGSFGWLQPPIGVFRRLFMVTSLYRFSRMLGLLLASRVPAHESLLLAGEVCGNSTLEYGAAEAAKRVAQGEQISAALYGARVFPQSYCWRVSLGESRGEAAEAVIELANAYDHQLQSRGQILTSIVGPIITVGVAIFVVLVIVALYLPVFSLSDALSG